MSVHGTSQPWQLLRRTAGHGSKADSDVPRITRELRLLTFEYPGERYAWPRESAFTRSLAGLINSRCPCHPAGTR
jgi:hypothetical protein